MRKYFYFLSMLALLCACSQEEQNVPELVDDSPRITFSDSQDFTNTLVDLFNKDVNEQTIWAKSKIPNPLITNVDLCSDEQMLALPSAYHAIFNDDLEIQVSDSVIRFDHGKLMLIAVGNQKLKEPLYYGEIAMESLGTVEDMTDESTASTRSTDFELNFGNVSVPSHQHEFKIPSKTKYTFKYVHEFVSLNNRMNGKPAQLLVLRYKLEYRGSGSWKNASEWRKIETNLNVTVGIKGGAQFIGPGSGLNFVYPRIQYIQDRLVAWVFNDVTLGGHTWQISVSGQIKETLLDFSGHDWTDTW